MPKSKNSPSYFDVKVKECDNYQGHIPPVLVQRIFVKTPDESGKFDKYHDRTDGFIQNPYGRVPPTFNR